MEDERIELRALISDIQSIRVELMTSWLNLRLIIYTVLCLSLITYASEDHFDSHFPFFIIHIKDLITGCQLANSPSSIISQFTICSHIIMLPSNTFPAALAI